MRRIPFLATSFLVFVITFKLDPYDHMVVFENDESRQNTTIGKNNTEENIVNRFSVPEGYERVRVDSLSFAHYLRLLPLKPIGATVYYFDGRTKPNHNIYEAVVDLPIGQRDLHQCADAIMRLRAEYLYFQKKYDSIHFNFTNGFRADYSKWKKGQRLSVKGSTVSWVSSAAPSSSYKDFWKYLEVVFSYAGTASLEQELESAQLEDLKIGDIFIQGGFPGHAVIVVDLAKHKTTGDTIFLLAQSYMPAQEIQILKNPKDSNLSPWYTTSKIKNELYTPEWVFKKAHLRRF